MKCETVEDLLLDFVEGELDGPQEEAVRSHVDKCAACKLSLKETRELLGVLDDARRTSAFSRSGAKGDSSAVMLGPSVWRAGEILGDFEILGEVGRGGMGIVYRARQVSLNRIVALKVLPGSVCPNTKAVARFQKEARAAAKLHHTNIVPVYAQGEHEGHFYYAMELIEGQGLDRVLRHDASQLLPVSGDGSSARKAGGGQQDSAAETTTSGLRAGYRRLALMVAGVAEGLAHAHQQGVIHRDIKPQNLLLGTDGLLHITDFGLARLLDEPSVTVSGEMLGTPAYMSPEQVGAHRSRIDHRTDIYSLGVTLYELLTRHRPFDGASREQIIARICTSEPRPPRKWNSSVPIDLETICLRAMEQDPRRRYQSAGDMAADLRRYAEDRPIVSRRVGPIEKAFKWVRRHRAVTAIIVLCLALVVGGAIWTRQSIKVNRERLEARHRKANELVQKAFDSLAYEDYRDTAKAVEWLKAAEELGPDPISYQTAVALANLRSDLTRAKQNLESALAQRPNDADLMYLLGWALRQEDDRNPAAREWAQRASAAGGATSAAGHFFHAQAVLPYAPDEAAEAYRQAIRQKDNYTQALVHLGRAHNQWMYRYRKHERFSEQEACLGNACRLQTRKAYPRYLLSIAYRLSAEIYEDEGKPDDAKAHFDRAFYFAQDAHNAEPESPLGYVCEAEYWEARNDYGRAIAAREKAREFCKTPTEVAGHVDQYHWRLCYWSGQPAPALQDLQRLAQTCADSDPHKIWYAGLFQSLIRADMGEMEEAIRLARSMAESEVTGFRAVTSSACMLRMLGRGDEADRLLAERAGTIDFSRSSGSVLPAGWGEAMYGFCQRRLSREALEQAAGARREDKLLWAAPDFFAAADAMGRGDREGALKEFERCDQTYDLDDYCYLARVFVRKLKDDPAWPAWVPAAALAVPEGERVAPTGAKAK
ncbi:MAG TPA: protein kinase [Phycisphaerae bacterium]|nr:protein kinase [Phycisphaerae bacterium]